MLQEKEPAIGILTWGSNQTNTNQPNKATEYGIRKERCGEKARDYDYNEGKEKCIRMRRRMPATRRHLLKCWIG